MGKLRVVGLDALQSKPKTVVPVHVYRRGALQEKLFRRGYDEQERKDERAEQGWGSHIQASLDLIYGITPQSESALSL